MSEKIDRDEARYFAACHAMQSGVASEMEYHLSAAHTPKHLRVGVNVAMRDHASLVELLIKKGLISREEYYEAMADGMEEEVARYERGLSEALGRPVKLS